MRLVRDDLSPVVAFCDPAGRPKSAAALKRVRARTALVVVGMDSLRRVLVLDAIAGRWAATETLERMYELATTWAVTRFGVEANAMQECYAQMIAEHARTSGRYLPIEEVYQPTGIDKLWRIRTVLEPVLNAGRLVVDDGRCPELWTELAGFPTARTVDLVDALASAIALLPVKAKVAETAEERDALRSYLERTGVAPDLIAARLVRFDAERRAAASTRAAATG